MKLAERYPFWVRYAFFAVLGLVAYVVLPEPAWTGFVVILVVSGWIGVWRRNRQRANSAGPILPEYQPPAGGGSFS